MSKITSTEINVKGNVCETSDIYLEFTIKHRKIVENEKISQLEDYKDINQDEKKTK